ncbi:helix-turn-helix domain-containing protein, partial [Klebsiella pneumoniae]|uniref:helix-turn-helix domain-containing protein n=1 Tax=Klebsiella pneumoniae TaxID=573 RepID=UPI003F6E1A0C
MRVNFDVLMILDALDRHGSFATAAESLYKTPAALSYMIQKLESDLNIVLWSSFFGHADQMVGLCTGGQLGGRA